jgi:hypothetical protein
VHVGDLVRLGFRLDPANCGIGEHDGICSALGWLIPSMYRQDRRVPMDRGSSRRTRYRRKGGISAVSGRWWTIAEEAMVPGDGVEPPTP